MFFIQDSPYLNPSSFYQFYSLIYFIIQKQEDMSMNIYVHEKGIILTGKAWEIREKLKEYANHFEYVKIGFSPYLLISSGYK